jgi:hypothetical protein
MATAKQTAANRINAQKSTGPRTTAGKAASRFNALKHGIYAVHQIMFDEKPEDLAELSAEYHEHHNPADADQRFLVDTLVNNEWRLRRTRRVEAELWQSASDLFIVRNLDTTVTCTSGQAFATDSATFERLQRVVNSCERVYHRALKELERLQAQAAQAEVGQAPSSTNASTNAPANAPANLPANPGPPPQRPATEAAVQPEPSKPTFGEMGSVRPNPQSPAPAASQPPAAPPFAGPNACPNAPANPAESRPSAADRGPNPPDAA